MIETRVDGSPTACFDLAASFQTVEGAVDAAVDALSGARTRAQDAWEGAAAEAFLAESASFRTELDTLQARTTDFRGELHTFAGALQAVTSAFSAIRSEAAGAGLAVTGTGVLPPRLADDADDDAVADYNAKVAVYNALVTRADDARRSETAAHEQVQAAASAMTADPVVVAILTRFGFLPRDTSPGWLAVWGLGRAGMATGWASSWFTRVRYGDFRPRHPAGSPGGIGGRYMSRADFAQGPWYRRAIEGARSTNYQARPYQSAAHSQWSTAGRWAGRAGTVLTVGTSAFDQWQADADDPSLGTTERVARSATAGATTGAGAWAGGLAGAKIGAGLGSLAGPVGTVVGGAVGGLVGGALGAGAGGWVADQVVDVAGDVADAVADTAGDVADAVGEGLGNAADAISDAWGSLWD